jgi:predicted metalloprotease with PDZ domain
MNADVTLFQPRPGVQWRTDPTLSQTVGGNKYFRGENPAPGTAISYYLKGAVLALILDLHLRRHGSALSVVLQKLWFSHGRHRRGYREVDLFAAFSSQAADLSTLLPQWLDQHDDPPVDDYLADVGLQLVAETSGHANAGWDLESSHGQVRLRRVSRQGPAERAGLEVGDELLAINAERLGSPELAAGLIGTAAEVELLFCRDGSVRTTRLEPGEPAVERWQLRSDPGADPARIAARQRWLSLLPAGPGALLGGWLGEHYGLHSALVFAGVTALLLALLRSAEVAAVSTSPLALSTTR